MAVFTYVDNAEEPGKKVIDNIRLTQHWFKTLETEPWLLLTPFKRKITQQLIIHL